ncbi:hypothetical protein ACFVQ9_35465 [Streptomyces goshikiensis]|uniref:hypothetical protein n=1 Tax=Streptomyces goshikiensis TaxID=1942 RepID=UPI0036A7F177
MPEALTTWFPDLDAEELARRADRHAFEHSVSLGFEPSNAPADRLTVNYLRHEFTRYDDEPTVERHREACEAIAARYPWLAAECAAQIDRRRDAEERDRDAAAMYEGHFELEQAERRDVTARSREAVKALSLGQRVKFKKQGRENVGTIAELGPSRVVVAYEVASGRDRARSVKLPAIDVEPVI